MQGYALFHRKMVDWEWYTDVNTFKLFFHIVLMANHKDKKVRGIMVKRGQHLTGRKKLSEQTGLSEQNIRTSLKKLDSEELTIVSTKAYTLITVNYYERYQINNQDNNQDTNQQLTNNQPTTNQQLTTNNNDNTDNTDKKKKLLLTCEEANEIYSHYPRKEGKANGIKKLLKIKTGETTKEIIIEKVKQYSEAVKGSDKQYIKIFSTWCNGEGWQDEYVTEKQETEIKYNIPEAHKETPAELEENRKAAEAARAKFKGGKIGR